MVFSKSQTMVKLAMATTNCTLTILLSFSLVICIFFFIPQSSRLTQSPAPATESKHRQFLNTISKMGLTLNPDGTFTRRRGEPFLTTPATGLNSTARVISRDVTINHLKRTWARVFIPRHVLTGGSPLKKVPIIVFVHGGGFILLSADFPTFHFYCDDTAVRLRAIVVSVEYRFAPEHRLPAAYDDVLEALIWIRDRKDEWVRRFGDLSRCVMMGESAGGNIVYNVGLMAADQMDQLQPLIIKGLALIQPFFGGIKKTGSEIRGVNDPSLALSMNEAMWNLSLPVGSDFGHEYCDPSVGGGSRLLDRVRDIGMGIAVLATGDDPLYDRDVEFAKMLERRGVRVRPQFYKNGSHGVFMFDQIKKQGLFTILHDFLQNKVSSL